MYIYNKHCDKKKEKSKKTHIRAQKIKGERETKIMSEKSKFIIFRVTTTLILVRKYN